MVDSTPDLLTVAEVAQRLRVGPNTVRTMIARRELRAVKMGKQWRIHAISVERLVDGGQDVSDSDRTDVAGQGKGSPSTAHGRAPRAQGAGQEAGGNDRGAGAGDRETEKSAGVILRHGTG